SIALSGSGFFYCRLGDCLWVRLEAKNNVEQYQGVNRSVRRRCFRVRSPRPPQTSRFSLPSFVIRGFLSSEHGGRRANPLFSILWYSLQTFQALYVYAIGLCFVADLLIHEIRVRLLNEARPRPARRGLPPRSAGGVQLENLKNGNPGGVGPGPAPSCLSAKSCCECSKITSCE